VTSKGQQRVGVAGVPSTTPGSPRHAPIIPAPPRRVNTQRRNDNNVYI
jgi:hypothetical protein